MYTDKHKYTGRAKRIPFWITTPPKKNTNTQTGKEDSILDHNPKNNKNKKIQTHRRGEEDSILDQNQKNKKPQYFINNNL